jgi:hypothetical protein
MAGMSITTRRRRPNTGVFLRNKKTLKFHKESLDILS